MAVFKINELFTSIQGEGLLAGRAMNFIRFCRCNLSCVWCDTEFSSGSEKSIDEIINELDERISWVSLTGGEPMLEENLHSLIDALKNKGYLILLETNSTLFNKKVFDSCDFVSADIKAPSSGNPGYVEEVFDYCIGNPEKTQIKIVVQNEEDFNYFKSIYIRYPNWIIQPEWSVRETLNVWGLLEDASREMLSDIRVLPQIHKTLRLK